MNDSVHPRTQVRRGLGAALLALGVLLSSSGCGFTGGSMGYFLGIGRGRKIEPQYRLPGEKLLVLVDDPRELVNQPRTRDLLAQYVAEDLLANKAIKSIIRPETLTRLRQSDPSFGRISAHKIGRNLDADTVLWLEIREYNSPTRIEDTSSAAKMTVAVKVLNAREEVSRGRVRLWPSAMAGQVIEQKLNAIAVKRLGTVDKVSDDLAARLARQIGRLFYQHTAGDLDDEERG